MTLLQQINREKLEYENQDITVVDGFTFNQKENIERIYRYYNSKFETGDIDAEGNKKYFFNIVRNPCKVTTKAIDFDTKHIRIETAGGGDPMKTWYFERDLKYWMKDKGFGKVLNRIFKELPIFGSVVLKVIDGKPYFVDLRNFVVEQTADTLDKSAYIIETHLYTPRELRKWGKKLGWEGVEDTIRIFREQNGKDHYIRVYERYGEVPEVDVKGNTTYIYKRIFLADVGKDELDRYGQVTSIHPGIILSETEMENHPYKEFHLDKLSGRWLGMGVVEILYDPQMKMNENANLEAKGSYWASMRAYQTADESVNRNLKRDVYDGEILIASSPISPIDTTDRNLAFFNQQYQKWMQNRDENTFSYDVIQGERLPAGTPLGSARLAAAMAGSYFDQIQEDVAMDVKDLLFNVIIPQFEKENTTEHQLRLVGESLKEYRKMLVNAEYNNAIVKFAAKKHSIPDSIQGDAIKAAIMGKYENENERFIPIKKGFYENIKYNIDILITGEQKDASVYAQSMFAILQAITVDPTALTDPIKRKIIFKIAESAGIRLEDIVPIKEETPLEQMTMNQQLPKGAGGGVSRPAYTQGGGQQMKIEQNI